MDESAKIDANQQKTLLAVTNAATPEIKNVRCDANTGRVLVSAIVSGVSDITVANEATDTSCFPLFATAATGSIQPKTNAGLTFNSNTGNLGATLMNTHKITVGVAGTATGSIELNGTTSGTVTLKTADAAGTYTLTLPTSDGDADQFLQTNGSGVLTWADGGGGTPTAITVADEATDTSCFICFFTAATGDLGPKTNANLTFNSNTGVLGAGGLALGTGSITMSGSIGFTGTRVTKGWFTDIESTNCPTFNGTKLPSGTGTANEIAYWTATNTIGTLAVATYPSLTELSYVKGVSSAIQTQIGNKANSASPTFTGTVTLADNCRIDLTLPSTDTYCTGPTTDSFAAGYSSSVGDLVYFGSGGKWLEADADAIATSGGLLGIALEAKSDTQAMKVALPGSMIRLDSWNWTVGKTLYAGETLGALSESIPTGADGVVRVVGFALSADVIYFIPSSDHATVTA